MSRDREMTYVQINEQVTLQNQDPVLNECAARLGVSLFDFGDIKLCLNTWKLLTRNGEDNQRELDLFEPLRLNS
jgi:hypothetical protein